MDAPGSRLQGPSGETKVSPQHRAGVGQAWREPSAQQASNKDPPNGGWFANNVLTIAARRAGITCLVFPEGNRHDFEELPDYLKEDLEIHFCSHYDEVFDVAFMEDRFFD